MDTSLDVAASNARAPSRLFSMEYRMKRTPISVRMLDSGTIGCRNCHESHGVTIAHQPTDLIAKQAPNWRDCPQVDQECQAMQK